MPSNDVDLEVLLGWIPEAEGFRITILYSAPGDQEDNRYFGRDPIRFDLHALDDLRDETEVAEYGQLLGSMLFADAARIPLDKAVAASRDAPVHLRIVVDPHAPPVYHAIRWETICQPSSGQPLTTMQNIRFSRFMAPAHGNQPRPLVQMGMMNALVAVANPTGIANFANFDSGPVELEPIAVETELARARAALERMNLRELPANGRRATRANIIEELSKGVHVLYLVCHGRIHDGRPQLLLEDEDGNTAVVDGTEFANDFGSMEHIPTVVVLCSCQSAGTGRIDRPAGTGAPDATDPRMSPTAKDLAAIGPALAYAGATVVVGMQGNLTMKTAERLLLLFFQKLNEHGGVPARAMAAARLAVRHRSDWYMPVLYSRLKRGSAWYRAGFAGDKAKLFRNLHTRIRHQHCTPIVGSGIAGEDGVLPSRQELAHQWVTRRQMPISEVSRTDLATVAQFVRVDEGGISVVRDEMHDLLLGELKARHAKSLPELDFDIVPLHTLVSEIGKHQRAVLKGDDGYSKLAKLKLPVYITTSWTSLLEEALNECGRMPVVRHFDWRKSTSVDQWPYEPSDFEDEDEEGRREVIVGARDRGGERFSVDRPLVYHLSGTLEYPRTLVLTEDDYFMWLQEWMKQVDNGNSIPGYVKRPLITNSLLFLGYHFDDWEFRMIFQAIKSFQHNTDDDGPHVGVQLEPTTLRVDLEAAQNYLESYFGADKIGVFWQTCNMFLKDLEATRPR